MLTGYLARPPVADEIQHVTTVNFDGVHEISDPYHWLRDDARRDSKVLDYLQRENQYAEQYLKQLDKTIDSLVHDVDARVPQTEISQPLYVNGHVYYRKRGPGDDYWTLYRWPLSSPAPATEHTAPASSNPQTPSLAKSVALAVAAAAVSPTDNNDNDSSLQQVVLDENALSAGHKYWDVYGAVVSPDGSKVAVPYDTVGDECYSLQVYCVSTGQALLDPPISGCTGDVVWWGTSSDTLVYITQANGFKTDGTVAVRVLRLLQEQQQQTQQQQPPQQQPPEQPQQQQHQQQHPQQQLVSAILYAPVEGESRLSLKISHDKQFVILQSHLEGGNVVKALSTSQSLTLTGSSNGGSSSSSGTPEVLAVPGTAWLDVISPDDDLDVLQIDHIGNLGQAGGSSSSSTAGLFVAIIDNDDAPDGQLVLLDMHQDNKITNLTQRKKGPSKEVLLANSVTSTHQNTNNNSINSGSAQVHQSKRKRSSSYAPAQQYITTEQQQQQPLHMEMTRFAIHPASGYLAVAVRRTGVCAIDVYRLCSAQHNPATAAGAEHPASKVPVVTLHTTGGRRANSSGISSKHYQEAAAAGAAANCTATITTTSSSSSGVAADLSWVLVADDSTLVMHLDSAEGSAAATAEAWLVVHVSGLTTPTTVYYVNLETQQQVKVYEEAVVGFDPGQYTSRLEWAVSHDGAAVPVTLAYKNGLMKEDGTNRALLQGYGAYGSKQWPSFNPADMALLDRGFVLAVAHVRGGGELGSAWHIHGKKFHKLNTFKDFLAVAHHLVQQQYTQPNLLAVWGRSAGGLTVAAALNLNTTFARVAVLDVPFLDVLNTMRDPDLPLTVKERSEWGDPLSDKDAFEYISSYSPYSNINPDATYPAMLLTASLQDNRVNYWEAAKYTAALRHYQSQQQQQQQQQQQGTGARTHRPVLLITDMAAGHFAASAASSRLQEWAMKSAFILQNLGCK